MSKFIEDYRKYVLDVVIPHAERRNESDEARNGVAECEWVRRRTSNHLFSESRVEVQDLEGEIDTRVTLVHAIGQRLSEKFGTQNRINWVRINVNYPLLTSAIFTPISTLSGERKCLSSPARISWQIDRKNMRKYLAGTVVRFWEVLKGFRNTTGYIFPYKISWSDLSSRISAATI